MDFSPRPGGSASGAGAFGKWKRAGVHRREALQSDQRDLGEALRCQSLEKKEALQQSTAGLELSGGSGFPGPHRGSASAWKVFFWQSASVWKTVAMSKAAQSEALRCWRPKEGSASVLDAGNKRSASTGSASFVKLGWGLMRWRETKPQRAGTGPLNRGDNAPLGRPLPAGY